MAGNQTRLMYIELKSGYNDNGPARWVARVGRLQDSAMGQVLAGGQPVARARLERCSMEVLNAGKSSEYFDSIEDEREDSAVSVIHAAWLEHSSSLGRLEHLEPTTPLDMLLLYQAAAATFKDWDPCTSQPEKLAQGGRVVNREQAKRRLESVTDPEAAALATRFANQVMALSESAAAEQDLNYCVELFLRCVQDKRVIEGIVSGEISRHSKQLKDFDFDMW